MPATHTLQRGSDLGGANPSRTCRGGCRGKNQQQVQCCFEKTSPTASPAMEGQGKRETHSAQECIPLQFT